MHAGSRTRAASSNVDWGVSLDISALTAPLGFGLEQGVLGLGFKGENSWNGKSPSVNAERADSQSMDVSFSFDIDIATSASPWQAGQASDLILGGGMNLQIQRAIVVEARRPDASSSEVCISTTNTSEWLPPSVTTYLLSVFEIEQLIEKLGYEIQLGDVNGTARKAIGNWETVLRTYRNSTTDSAEAVETVVSGMLNSLNSVLRSLKATGSTKPKNLEGLQEDFDEEPDSTSTYETFIDNGLRDLKDAGFSEFRPLAPNLGSYDNYGPRMRQNMNALNDKLSEFTDTNCGSGDAFGLGDLCDTKNKIQERVNLAQNLMGICDFDEAQTADDYSPMAKFCQKRTAEDQATVDIETLPSGRAP